MAWSKGKIVGKFTSNSIQGKSFYLRIAEEDGQGFFQQQVSASIYYKKKIGSAWLYHERV